MKKRIFTIICIALLCHLQAQRNLVGNYDFQVEGPTFNCMGGGSSNSQDDLEATWAKYAPWTVPLKWKPWNRSVGSPDFHCSGGAPTCGPHCAAVGPDEFVCQELGSPIQWGHSYYIEYWVINHNPQNDHHLNQAPGLKLVKDHPKQRRNHILKRGYGDATLGIPESMPFNEWYRVSGTTPGLQTDYNWVNLGRHKWWKPSDADAAFLDFDGIKIVDVGTSYCPEYNFIQDALFSKIGKITYRSSILTIAGNNVDNTIPAGPVSIGTEAIVRFQSAELVSLMDGFSVENGGEFEAIIAPCYNDCPLPIAEAPYEIDACDAYATQYAIGANAIFGQTYSWSLGQPSQVTGFNQGYNYLNLLNSTTSSNPTFTTPHGYGVITYVLTATNACGQSSSTEVRINIDENPNPNPPQLSYSSGNYYGNYDPNTHTIDFYINGITNNVEEITIDITDENGNFVHQYELEGVNGFGSSGMVWSSTPDTYTPCVGYQAHIRQKNHCSDNLGPELVVPVQSQTAEPYIEQPVPNFFTPNGDEFNPVYSMQVQNAASYNIWVYDPGGVLIYTGSGSVTSSTAVVWDGTTNHNNPLINPMHIVCNGWYAYVVYFYNCHGDLETHMAGSVEVLGVDCDTRLAAPNTNEPPTINIQTGPVVKTESKGINAELKRFGELSVFPNPNDGNFRIGIPLLLSNATLQIVNSLGEVVRTFDIKQENQSSYLDITEMPHGVYYVKLIATNGLIVDTKRVVITR